MMNIPENLGYTSEHEWLLVDSDRARIGITAYAANQLGDVVFVELPEIGARVSAGRVIGELESTKSVGEIFAPADGEIIELNQQVLDDPGLINSDPYGEGWLAVIKLDEQVELLSAEKYAELIKS